MKSIPPTSSNIRIEHPQRLPPRFRAPFLPIHPPPLNERLVISLEKLIKGGLFKCSMCGICLLQETVYICPLLCPKGLRNGPCGSGSCEKCCVEPSRPCVWHMIYMRAEKRGTLDRLLEVQAPLDWNRIGHETWVSVIKKAIDKNLITVLIKPKGKERTRLIDDFFRELRQPEWWQGDASYHPPAFSKPVSRLQDALDRGEFVVTAEITPPIEASADRFVDKACELKDLVHAINITQNPMASPRMSSLACSVLLVQKGIEPILQLTARDYNRLALQSAALGASAVGVRNILCLTGDPPIAGRGPVSGLPFDLDATQMLWLLRRLRDEGHLLDGSKVDLPPKIFLGSAASPNDPDLRHEVLRLKKKINSGAQFLQTQLVFSIHIVEEFLEAMDKSNLLDKVDILIGVAPIRSLKMARFIQVKIPDIFVPKELVTRLERSKATNETGIEIVLELIQQIKPLPGVSGIHIMNLGGDSFYPRLLQEAGLIKTIPNYNLHYNELDTR